MRENLKKARREAGMTQQQARGINANILIGNVAYRNCTNKGKCECHAIFDKDKSNFCWNCGKKLKKSQTF